MKKVLVIGAGGQLGQCFKKKTEKYPNLEMVFTGSDVLDISMFGVVSTYFRENDFDYCINCAAYTNVEQAETNREMAFLVNSEAVLNLAEACEENDCTLVHFSTDYVFDGTKETPYTEEDETDPLNVYGASKLAGEEHIQQVLEQHFIFRTSWLYSNIGHNFFNTIRKKATEVPELKIITSQKGTPTNAYDLAELVLDILSEGSNAYGLYHYSNHGEATWYDFAEEILRLSGLLHKVNLQRVESFESLAVRPTYSVLSKEKIQAIFQKDIKTWQESLAGLF